MTPKTIFKNEKNENSFENTIKNENLEIRGPKVIFIIPFIFEI